MGVSGNMLLGALDDLGALGQLDGVLAGLPDVGAGISRQRVRRGGIDAVHIDVTAPNAPPHRFLADVLAIIDRLQVPDVVRRRAAAVFTRLADAEAAVHATTRDEVAFHEVGAVDAIVDVVGACLGLHALALDELFVSTVALGAGQVETRHGRLPVPTPAVVELLEGSSLAAVGGPVDLELATPTGVALLAELAGSSRTMPEMRVSAVGVGAGSADPEGHANVLRLVVGEPVNAPAADSWVLLEANVDDMDPRLWPLVIDALLAAGAADAWLTPILMKKGRPAHTVGALAPAEAVAAVRAVLFRESSTIGVRQSPVDKHGLDRQWVTVDVAGQPVRVKVARHDGVVVNVTPEWEDVATAARTLDQPAKSVLAAAVAAAEAALA
ncbi:MAG: nickel pincer cofactor biosynthesis protein LarC [Frankiales bacterium]|nr:nickel pincer cofactor biosynthesis protein LarC [Frankiales bacterium]